MALYIKYDNTALQDGLGAQSLRILGIYSISRFFRINYLHNPILKIIEEYAHSLKGEDDLQNLINRTNSLFNFESNCEHPLKFKEIVVHNLTLRTLFKHYFRYRFSKKNLVLKVLLPFGVTDKIPNLFEIGARKTRDLNRDIFKTRETQDVVVHIRWGYGWKYSDQEYIRPRHLPFSYYSKAMEKVKQEFFPNSQNLQIKVHTDLSRLSEHWRPYQENVNRGFKNVTGESANEGIPIEGYDLEALLKFPDDSSYQIAYCDDFFETFLDMTTAHCLIMATSTLSYLAGILNENIVVFPTLHRNSPLKRWYQSESLGIHNSESLLFG